MEGMAKRSLFFFGQTVPADPVQGIGWIALIAKIMQGRAATGNARG